MANSNKTAIDALYSALDNTDKFLEMHQAELKRCEEGAEAARESIKASHCFRESVIAAITTLKAAEAGRSFVQETVEQHSPLKGILSQGSASPLQP